MKISRRHFIQAAGLGAVLSALDSQNVFGMGNPFGQADPKSSGVMLDQLTHGQSDMRIVKIESFTKEPLSFVKVTTDGGREGYGQIAPYDADISAGVLHRRVAPLAVNRDPYDMLGLSELCMTTNLRFPWSYVCRALAGLDTALWDLKGKAENKSVCELLGGTPTAQPVYGSSMRRDITPTDEARRMVELRDRFGYQAFKVRIGTEAGHNKDQWEGRTEELIPAVREALGDRIELLADANSGYTIDQAIKTGRLLQKYKYAYFEEPCPYWEYEMAAKVNKPLRIKLTGGQQDNDLAQWRRIIEAQAYNILQPDVCYIGGLTRTLQVVEMAYKAKVPVMLHSADLSLVTVFSLHLMGAVPNAGPYVEYTIENDAWTRDLYEPVLKVRDGRVAVPNGPGWGVTLNKTWLEGAQYQKTEAS